MELTIGLSASFVTTVTDADTALEVGSGDVPVLATPRVVALAERATVLAVAASLPSNCTSVGTTVNLKHVRASSIGAEVATRAELVGIDGPRLRFGVTVHDGEVLVAEGEIHRVVVDRETFLTRVGSPR